MKRACPVWMFLPPVLASAGCALTSPAPRDQAPGDFGLSVTIAPGETKYQQGWLVLDPDGVLRAAVGKRTRVSAAPQEVRTLSRAEVRELWGLARSVEPGPAEALSGVEVHANGRVMRAPLAQGSPAATLAERMAELAWMPEEAP